MKPRKIRKYVIKGYTPILYTWAPDTTITKIKPSLKKSVTDNPVKRFCKAIPGSQGEDYITDYVYEIRVNTQNEIERLAYVECDYVE
jgi:hypothetical protein